jgi:hypothetical protein
VISIIKDNINSDKINKDADLATIENILNDKMGGKKVIEGTGVKKLWADPVAVEKERRLKASEWLKKEKERKEQLKLEKERNRKKVKELERIRRREAQLAKENITAKEIQIINFDPDLDIDEDDEISGKEEYSQGLDVPVLPITTQSNEKRPTYLMNSFQSENQLSTKSLDDLEEIEPRDYNALSPSSVSVLTLYLLVIKGDMKKRPKLPTVPRLSKKFVNWNTLRGIEDTRKHNTKDNDNESDDCSYDEYMNINAGNDSAPGPKSIQQVATKRENLSLHNKSDTISIYRKWNISEKVRKHTKRIFVDHLES